MYWLY